MLANPKPAVAVAPTDGPWSLPASWEWASLSQRLAEKRSTFNPKTAGDEIVELYSVPSFECRMPEVVPAMNIGSSKQHVEPDDILLCGIIPRINRVWVVGKRNAHRQIASTEWMRFQPSADLNPHYLRYFLSTEYIRQFLILNASGVGGSLMRARKGTIAPLSFPKPPIEIQNKIVRRLDSLFAEIAEGERALTKAREGLNTYRAALLNAAVTGEMTAEWRRINPPTETGADLLRRILADRRSRWEADAKNRNKRYPELLDAAADYLPQLPNGWVWATAGALTNGDKGSIVIGPFGSDLKVSDYRNEGVRLVFVRHIRSEDFEGQRPQYITPEKANKLSAHETVQGDILITKMGDPPGDVAIYSASQPAIITADCIRWRPHPALNVEYLAGWIKSFWGRAWIRSMTKGVAQQKITLEIFKGMPVALPGAAEQDLIVQRWKNGFDFAVEMGPPTELSTAVTLRQSILSAAFRGELV